MACQAHPALVKIGPVLVEAWRFDGDPAPLARNNLLLCKLHTPVATGIWWLLEVFVSVVSGP